MKRKSIFLAFVVMLVTTGVTFGCDNCIAKAKSEQQAREGRMRHVGGSMGTGRYEGVGFSTVSADDAIRKCCYWGVKKPTGISAVRGARGWFATVIYR